MFTFEFFRMLEYFLVLFRRVRRRGILGGEMLCESELFSSRQKRHFGNGTEFADHRVYVQGDDLRHLDWNLFARFGESFIKRFEFDADVNIYFLLDSSASMQVGAGEQNKYDYSRRLIASLSYLALSELNRVGVFCFSGGLGATFPPVRGKGQFLKLLKFLERSEVAGGVTDICLSVEEFIRRVRRTGVVVIVSDFYVRDNFRVAVERLRYNKFDPMIIQIHTEFESDPELDPQLRSFTRTNFNLVSVEDESLNYSHVNSQLEPQDYMSNTMHITNNNELNVTINKSILNQYRKCFADFLNDIKTYCTKIGANFTIANTSIPFDKIILQMINNSNNIKTK